MDKTINEKLVDLKERLQHKPADVEKLRQTLIDLVWIVQEMHAEQCCEAA